MSEKKRYHAIKFRMQADLVEALIKIAHTRKLEGETPNISALVRSVLRQELKRPPPPAETYDEVGGEGIYTIRMPPDLLEALKRQSEQTGETSMSSLIRAMLRRWLKGQQALPKISKTKKGTKFDSTTA